MGHTHALTGAVAALCAAPLVAQVTHVGWAEVGVMAAATAGTAMLPDLDHPQSTIARTFGWPTQMLAQAVASLAGGHRKATHGLGFAVVTGLLAWGAVLLGPVGRIAVVTLALGLGLRALGFTKGGVSGNLGTFAVCALLATGLETTVNLTWLPVAYTLGCLAHLAGDILTNSGVPLLWPLPRRFRLGSIATGGGVEKWVVSPLLLSAIVALVGYRL